MWKRQIKLIFDCILAVPKSNVDLFAVRCKGSGTFWEMSLEGKWPLTANKPTYHGRVLVSVCAILCSLRTTHQNNHPELVYPQTHVTAPDFTAWMCVKLTIEKQDNANRIASFATSRSLATKKEIAFRWDFENVLSYFYHSIL